MSEVTFRISGKAMVVIEGSEIYYSPEKYDGGTQGAQDAFTALRSATVRRAGRGRSYIVTTTIAGADTIADYCETVGSTFVGFDGDPEAKADGRALLAVAERIKALLDAEKGSP